MRKTEQPFTKRSNNSLQLELPVAAILVCELLPQLDNWLADCDMANHARTTNEVRRIIVSKLIWFCDQKGYTSCGLNELRQFFAYLNHGHESEEGRWGNAQGTKCLRPSTVENYHKHLRRFFTWLISEDVLEASPMEKVKRVISRSDQIQPFTREQVSALLEAARRSRNRRRDEAIITLLFDTGLRASELCGLRLRGVDLDEHRCRVLGKGNKFRTVPFGKASRKALWQYLRQELRDKDDPLFTSERGVEAGSPMTRSGLFQLIQRMGESAGINATRCSPHTFRHTFAVECLRNGGNTFSLMLILGHTSLHMTNKYVALAQADIQQQHHQFSPADRLERGR